MCTHIVFRPGTGITIAISVASRNSREARIPCDSFPVSSLVTVARTEIVNQCATFETAATVCTFSNGADINDTSQRNVY